MSEHTGKQLEPPCGAIPHNSDRTNFEGNDMRETPSQQEVYDHRTYQSEPSRRDGKCPRSVRTEHHSSTGYWGQRQLLDIPGLRNVG